MSLLREDPGWLIDVLVQLGEVEAGYAIERLPTEIWPIDEERRVRELRADVVLRLWPQGVVPRVSTLRTIRKAGVIGLLLEAQCHVDLLRVERWREFATVYLPMFGSPPILIILAVDPHIVRWIESIIDVVRKHVRVVLLVPGTIPRINAIEPRDTPHRALLEAMIHVRGESELHILMDALRALEEFEGPEHMLYRQMLHSQLEEDLIMRAHQEIQAEEEYPGEGPPDFECDDYVIYNKDYDDPDYEISETELKSFLYVRGLRAGVREGRQEGRQEGRVEGIAAGVITLLRARGLVPTEALEAQVMACRDLDQLQRWLVRAARVDDAARILDEPLDPLSSPSS